MRYKLWYMKNLRNAVLVLIMAAGLYPAALQAQNKEDKQTQVKNIVTSQNYVFKALTALPVSGRIRQLNTDFDLRVSKDTIVSYLPYFGRAYSAPMNPSESPLSFTSTQFDYKVTSKKKRGWDVVITPRDLPDPRQIYLSIFDNGTASLTVTSNNSQSISFNGYITAKK